MLCTFQLMSPLPPCGYHWQRNVVVLHLPKKDINYQFNEYSYAHILPNPVHLDQHCIAQSVHTPELNDLHHWHNE